MFLCYNPNTQLFSLSDNGENEIIFEAYTKEERLGKIKGVNPPIEIGHFKIDIKTNFYPKAKEHEFIVINVFVDGVKLLPLSMAIRKAYVNYYIGKHNISFQQFGSGKNNGKEPATIVLLKDKADWNTALQTLCDICNNYAEWIETEMRHLISSMISHKKTGLCEVSEFIELVRVYDKIVPSIIPVYRQFIDSRCVEAMKDLLDYIASHKMREIDCNEKIRHGNALWQYIKDYTPNNEIA